MSAREERWQRRLAVPVLVAALASIPAMFLTFADGRLGTAGRLVDALSGAVLLAETVILMAVAESKRAWIRGHLGMLTLTALVLVAVVFALGPVQILRLVRTVGALRVLRARRIVKAAQSLRARTGLTGRLSYLLSAGAGLLVALFVAAVLADPTSRTRSLITAVVGEVSTPVTVVTSVLSGLLLGVATFLLARDPGTASDAGHDVPSGEPAPDPVSGDLDRPRPAGQPGTRSRT